MKKHFTLSFILLLIFNISVFAQPSPPSGKKWEKVALLSDEFEGGRLNGNKWIPNHPYWDGRDPSQFLPANVSQDEGQLRLKSTVKNSNKRGNWVWSSCVTSKTRAMKKGYYSEAKIKCSKLSMTTSFWFQGRYSEIDVIENFGAPSAPKYRNHNKNMKTNTHYFKNGWDNDEETPWEMGGVSPAVGDAFHTYGVWWKDSRTMVFYLNGEEVHTTTTKGNFDEDMYMFFDAEVFSWGIGLPSLSSLRDDSKNTGLVEWVHTYKLVNGNSGGSDGGNTGKKDEIAFSNAPKTISSKKRYTLNVSYEASTTRELVVEVWSGSKWLGSKKATVSAGKGRKSLTIDLSAALASGTGYTYKAHIRPVGTNWRAALDRDQVDNVTVTSAPSSNLIAEGTYYITSITNNQQLLSRELDRYDAKMHSPGNFADQQWTLKHLGNAVYTIQNKATGRYLEVSNAQCGNGKNVATWINASNTHKQWKAVIDANDNYSFKPMHCLSKALDRAAGALDANAQLWDYDASNTNQKWSLRPVVASNSKLVAESFDGSPEQQISLYPNPSDNEVTLSGTVKGDIVIIHDFMGTELKRIATDRDNQVLSIEELRAGSYIISIMGKGSHRLMKM